MSRRVVGFAGIASACLLAALWPASTRQGINHQVQTIRIPLFWKGIHFLSRHHEMDLLTRRVVQGYVGDSEKALAIFDWVRANVLAGVPEGWPVIDDHVLHIALRRYGTEDQHADLLTALCAYAGLPSRWYWVLPPSRRESAALCLVEIQGRLVVMDPFRGYVGRSPSGELWDLVALKNQIRSGEKVGGGLTVRGIPYEEFLLALPLDLKSGMNRGISQMPFARLFQKVRDWFPKSEGKT